VKNFGERYNFESRALEDQEGTEIVRLNVDIRG
jgi:hypothetical protein